MVFKNIVEQALHLTRHLFSNNCKRSSLVLTFLVLPFWYLLTRVDPDIFQTSSKTVVCVCVCKRSSFFTHMNSDTWRVTLH